MGLTVYENEDNKHAHCQVFSREQGVRIAECTNKSDDLSEDATIRWQNTV